ncbi:hypothetical protein Bca52824_029865 [Brassica carinata]|uniref:Uncharacterized protein n=1 Tax=Brassica carinata TaxID=52824 RepID=A0A8X7V3T5_BRACI|nr:hypothetical protein Bca52824_029865 [Brassica carinata]
MVISQAEESDFRALQEAPYASWRAMAWRRFGDFVGGLFAVFGLSVVLGEGRAVAVLCSLMGVQVRQIPTTLDLRALEIRLLGVCSSCCRRVSNAWWSSRSAAPERCWRRRLWRLQGDVVAFLSIFLPLPVCGVSSFLGGLVGGGDISQHREHCGVHGGVASLMFLQRSYWYLDQMDWRYEVCSGFGAIFTGYGL